MKKLFKTLLDAVVSIKLVGEVKGKGTSEIRNVLRSAKSPLSLVEIADRANRRKGVKALIELKKKDRSKGATFSKESGKKPYARENKVLKSDSSIFINRNFEGKLIKGASVIGGLPLIKKEVDSKGITRYSLTSIEDFETIE